MLDRLRIHNFRMLKDFSVEPLGRVNLIVGRNNSGKSTVLEAMRLLAEGGNGRFLQSLLGEHDELIAVSDRDPEGAAFLAIRNFFTGRTLPKSDADFIFIGSDISKSIKLEHIFFELQEELVKDKLGNVLDGLRRQVRVPILKSAVKPDQAIREGLRTTQQGGLLTHSILWDMADPWSPNRKTAPDVSFGIIPYGFIPTHFVDQDNLASWWDQVVFTPAEQRVLAALRIIEPNVDGLAFIKSPRDVRYGRPRERAPDRIPVVKLRGQAEPVPLNSMGDGMFRLLQLLLAASQAKGGFLLVDEFENGLHFTVQEAVWRMVFQIAVELDMQVFATTHSWDCIESFVRVAQERPKEGVLFKMSRSRLKSDEGKIIATVYDEERLALATAMEMEVR